LEVADHVPAMLAYWNRDQVCVFANETYRAWFGRSHSQLIGSTMQEVLGPLYAANLPHIQRALAGEAQVFERTIPQPGGDVRESLATYTPHVVDGAVQVSSCTFADVTPLKTLERQMELALHTVRTLRGLLPICVCTARRFATRTALGPCSKPICRY